MTTRSPTTTSSTSQEDELPEDRRFDAHDLRLALLGGVVAALVGFAGMAIVGTANSFQAQRLLDAVLPTVRFAASAYVAGGATVLALMLTLLTFSISHDREVPGRALRAYPPDRSADGRRDRRFGHAVDVPELPDR
ncbi:MAG: hypothetical protein R2710_04530 [Acidimicrobiales bacterium]